MKKLFYSLLLAAATATAHATDYTDNILVLVNGQGSTQKATISVNERDGLYDLNLKNFILMNGQTPMPVGNVELKGIVPEKAGDAIFLRTSQDITVTEGDQPGVLFWMGPMLGELFVNIPAVLTDDGLRALIDLDLTETFQQVINVSFGDGLVTGKGYHVPNGDFEAWHTSTEDYEEPNAWHSFESASGDFAALAGHHIEKSDKGRNGSTCARIYATSIFGIVANGTMTTGRMNAGSMFATDKANHAYVDTSLKDVDGNGDPFYVALNSRPDSLVLWLQFRQSEANSKHPYATVSAAITDGTRYQDPEDKEYDNVVARAVNNKISVTGKEWQRISIPFVYTDITAKPRALMITVSTNADAGQGSEGDEVLVDDLTLVYNSRLAALSVDGFQPDVFDYTTDSPLDTDDDDFVCQANGKGAYVLTKDNKDEGTTVIDVFAADLRSRSTYTVSHGSNGPKKGDVNGDGAVDVADISTVITVMAEGSATIPGASAPGPADVNGDGTVDVADISTIISIMSE